jgi:hypothetical protein
MVVVHARAVKIYVAKMETLKKKEQQGSKCFIPVIPKWVSQKKQGVVKNGVPAQLEK